MRWRGLMALLAAVGILLLVNAAIVANERLMRDGRMVYLELAPVDPRSLMQGDYMALNYQVSLDIRAALPPADDGQAWPPRVDARDGHVVVSVDEMGIGRFRRIDAGEALAVDEQRLQYRVRAGQVRFASNAYFFQEGTAEEYTPARYGRFAVEDGGRLLLVALHDGALRPLPLPKDQASP